MTGEHTAVILDAVLSFYKRGPKVAYLRDNRKRKTDKRQGKIARVKSRRLLYDKAVKNAAENRKQDAADRSLNSLFGAEMGRKLVLAEKSAGEIREYIAHPRRHEYERENVLAVGHISRK